MDCVDIIVLGAGMAGASVAAHLSPRASVALVEAEDHPGRHSTARSAAVFFETYGAEPIRALCRASRSFLVDTPPGFSPTRLLAPRATLYVADGGKLDQLNAFAREPAIAAVARRVSPAEAVSMVPILNPEHIAGAILDTSGFDIDVDALLQGYLRGMKRGGGKLYAGWGFDVAVSRTNGMWHVRSSQGELRAPVIVNATGAWADMVAAAAEVGRIGLVPMRRTAVTVSPPPEVAIGDWPMVIDIEESFYFKPDAGQLLISPADETPSPPCDAAPEEIDIAIAIDRFERMTNVAVNKINHRWAGLRTFAADRLPVAGWAPDVPGFYWLAGQGGFGIQTAPAMASLAAAQILGDSVPAWLYEAGVDPDALLPCRAALRPNVAA